MISIAWQCGTQSCQNGVVRLDTTSYPGNVSMTMTGNANYCNSWLADCTNSDARILHTTVFSVDSAFSISSFVDIGSFIPNYPWTNNTGAGIGIFDATRNFYVLYCCMITWNGNTYRQGFCYGATRLPGGHYVVFFECNSSLLPLAESARRIMTRGRWGLLVDLP